MKSTLKGMYFCLLSNNNLGVNTVQNLDGGGGGGGGGEVKEGIVSCFLILPYKDQKVC
jgi:hypothetical protein